EIYMTTEGKEILMSFKVDFKRRCYASLDIAIQVPILMGIPVSAIPIERHRNSGGNKRSISDHGKDMGGQVSV
ncbi:hypothetical protein FRB99_003639, partial [Tulasnella sp. 403]